MTKTLIIAEKPSVARDIAKVMGAGKNGNGYIEGEKYIVSWAVGHLVTLYDPEDYDPDLKKWRYDTLPIIPKEIKLKGAKQTKDQLKVLDALLKRSDVSDLICATDSGREGELIFRYIYNLLKCKKPFQRLWISSMTDTAIKEGFAKLKDGKEYDNLYYSARCRSEADWLVGINASRVYTLKYNALLSIGRVQTPTLAIIVDKALEIAAFVPEEYYELKADYGNFWAMWNDEKANTTRMPKKEIADAIADKVKGETGKVLDIKREEKRQPAPQLYDLTELQRDCNKRFGFSAQQTLNIAQSLYETRKMITYPRTDSRYLSDDMIPKLKPRLQRLAAVPQFESQAKQVLNLEKLPISKRIIDNAKVSDHHAIIPTEGIMRVDGLKEDEYLVFSLIALRFLAVFYPNYVYATTKIVTEVVGERFISKGTEVLHMGWQELYKDFQDEQKSKKKSGKAAEKEDQTLPNLAVGDEVIVGKTEVLKKKTSPPKPYTEATLLSAMENAGRFVDDEELKEKLKEGGLGTPATRASIIERLITVGYITRKGKALQPTEKGMKLIEVVPKELKSAETTGRWEKGLTSIAKGSMESEVFMASIGRYVNFLVKDCKGSNRFVQFPEERKRYYKKRS